MQTESDITKDTDNKYLTHTTLSTDESSDDERSSSPQYNTDDDNSDDLSKNISDNLSASQVLVDYNNSTDNSIADNSFVSIGSEYYTINDEDDEDTSLQSLSDEEDDVLCESFRSSSSFAASLTTDSLELYPSDHCTFRRKTVTSEAALVKHNAMIEKARRISFSDHLQDRLWERGLCEMDFYKAVIFGERDSADCGWKFEYNGIVAITDLNIERGITIYELECAECGNGLKNASICKGMYCQSCCWGCDSCMGQECPECKRKKIDLLCDKGLCPTCCDGCITCAGETCPGCRDRGINILCERGFCRGCCYGCDTCCGQKCMSCGGRCESVCDRGYCAGCCYACPRHSR